MSHTQRALGTAHARRHKAAMAALMSNLLREISPFVRALAGRHCRNRADAE